MIEGLTRLVQYFTLSQDEKIDRRLRKQELCEVRQYCTEQGLEFYPEEVAKLPVFADEVNGFIERKARRDLPRQQFENSLRLADLSKWVEIGGVLGYNGKMFEMCYSPPDSRYIQVEKRFPNGRIISSATPTGRFCLDDLNRAEYIIDWHTHPTGFGEVSEGDVDHIKEFLEKFGEGKQIFFVVYRPAKNQSVWYQAKKAQPKE